MKQRIEKQQRKSRKPKVGYLKRSTKWTNLWPNGLRKKTLKSNKNEDISIDSTEIKRAGREL